MLVVKRRRGRSLWSRVLGDGPQELISIEGLRQRGIELSVQCDFQTQSPGPFIPVDSIEGLRVDQVLGAVVADVAGLKLSVDIESLPGCELGACVLTLLAVSEVSQEEYLVNIAAIDVSSGVDTDNEAMTLLKALDGNVCDVITQRSHQEFPSTGEDHVLCPVSRCPACR
ncbi:MAG: hypothetical protein ACI8S6_004505 [Myxococcota bacterium]|jgi:hypothetical protein